MKYEYDGPGRGPIGAPSLNGVTWPGATGKLPDDSVDTLGAGRESGRSQVPPMSTARPAASAAPPNCSEARPKRGQAGVAGATSASRSAFEIARRSRHSKLSEGSASGADASKRSIDC